VPVRAAEGFTRLVTCGGHTGEVRERGKGIEVGHDRTR
jgi:hypothetical protein